MKKLRRDLSISSLRELMISDRFRPTGLTAKKTFTLRFLFFGTLNYFTGNLIFTLFWWGFHSVLSYWIIATFATISASAFSYLTHTFGTLQSRSFKHMNIILYTGVQGFGLGISALIVPGVASLLETNLLMIQYIWSGIFSIAGILILKTLAKPA